MVQGDSLVRDNKNMIKSKGLIVLGSADAALLALHGKPLEKLSQLKRGGRTLEETALTPCSWVKLFRNLEVE